MPGSTDECVRFTPASVEGMPAVSEVAVFPDRLDVFADGTRMTFPFRSFSQRQEPLWLMLFKRLFRLRVLPQTVGQREYCTDRRYFEFYTNPRLRIFTPVELDDREALELFLRIHRVLHRGGYQTWDMS